MVRRGRFVSLVLVILLACMSGVSSVAQENVTSTSKKGSLLVFPFIHTGNGQAFDTIVSIANDGSSPVTVKCYWMDSDQNPSDFEFSLTPYQPAWFSAKTGLGSKGVAEFGGGLSGDLKCWAIDTTTDQESVKRDNHLYGSAMLINTDENGTEAFEYDAWAFALRTDISSPNPYSGPLNLNGTTDYDACPGYLVYNFFSYYANVPQPFGTGRSWLILSPCQQDLRQDRSPICTKAKFDVWNENETKFTGAYGCVKCWFEDVLQALDYYTWYGCDLPHCKAMGAGGGNFFRYTLHTDLGRLRVTPSTFQACSGVFAQFDQDNATIIDVCPKANQYQTPFVGTLITEMFVGADEVHQLLSSTGVGGGVWVAPKTIPQILWDAGAGAATAPKR
jgi:hypothetical protein